MCRPSGGQRAAARAERGERRQEPGERLARAGVGDEQRVAAGVARREHLGLMPTHPPAAAGEPGFELGRHRRHATGLPGAAAGGNWPVGRARSSRRPKAAVIQTPCLRRAAALVRRAAATATRAPTVSWTSLAACEAAHCGQLPARSERRTLTAATNREHDSWPTNPTATPDPTATATGPTPASRSSSRIRAGATSDRRQMGEVRDREDDGQFDVGGQSYSRERGYGRRRSKRIPPPGRKAIRRAATARDTTATARGAGSAASPAATSAAPTSPARSGTTARAAARRRPTAPTAPAATAKALRRGAAARVRRTATAPSAASSSAPATRSPAGSATRTRRGGASRTIAGAARRATPAPTSAFARTSTTG